MIGKTRKWILRIGWTLSCVLVYVLFPVVHDYCDSSPDIGCSLNWLQNGMALLSFPSGLAFGAVACGRAFPCGGEYDLYHAFLYWLGMFVTGYFQWFWLVPRMFKDKEVIRLSIER